MKISRSRRVAAPAPQALSLLRDLARIAEYNPGVRVESARRGPARPGDSCSLTVKAWPRPLRVRLDVVAVTETEIHIIARWLVDAVEVRWARPEPGGCTVGWDVTFRAPWYLGGRLAEFVYAPLAARNIDRELDGVQRILEGRET